MERFLEEAVEILWTENLNGFILIEESRKLIITRIQYCRRNSFDTYKTAFARGYGYCQQQAFALAHVLTRLGFDGRVVYAIRNKLSDGSVCGHAWVRVKYNGTVKEIDATHIDTESDALTFTPLTRVKGYSTLFWYFATWGSIGVNAYRYYKSGTDR